MMDFILACCFLSLAGLSEKWKPNLIGSGWRGNVYIVTMFLGGLLSLGTLWNAATSVFVSPDVAQPLYRFAFRNGDISVDSERSEGLKIYAFYKEWSWFRFKKEGEWRIMPDREGGWKYFRQGKWQAVPPGIGSPMLYDEREGYTDNRGFHEY